MYILELACINVHLVNKEAVKDPHLRILKFRDTLIKELTCCNDGVTIPSAGVLNADNTDVYQSERMEVFHSLEIIGPTDFSSVFAM